MLGLTGARKKDPVCGMNLEDKDVQATSTYCGSTYWFCSVACKQKFDQTPQKYVRRDDG